MCTLLIMALVLSSICVWTYVRRNMTDVIVDKYEFMNEKMGIALDNLYRKTDAVTAEIILENDVQKSLKNKELQEVEKNAPVSYTHLDVYKRQELQNMGIHVVMLTGDNERTAKAIGQQAGVDEVIAGVLPEGKEQVIRKQIGRAHV